jgi:hypothetical protein
LGLGFGLVRIDQLVPFQRIVSVVPADPPKCVPTA